MAVSKIADSDDVIVILSDIDMSTMADLYNYAKDYWHYRDTNGGSPSGEEVAARRAIDALMYEMGVDGV